MKCAGYNESKYSIVNKKLIGLYIFLVISISVIVYLRWDRSKPFNEVFLTVKNNLSTVQNMNFLNYDCFERPFPFSDNYSFKLRDSIHGKVDKNFLCNYEINKYDLSKFHNDEKLIGEFIINFNIVRKFCKNLEIDEISKSDNQNIYFIFRMDRIDTKTLPGRNGIPIERKERYDCMIEYNKANDYNMERYRDMNCSKLEDNWYLLYYERRPN
jgi:hypothetical protein